ncbi:MAG: methyl-accepting chemotaxis protein [Firmicutes bacterium]|nr:methyl-accepting chemotaxis protein [Bacillota bacterium]
MKIATKFIIGFLIVAFLAGLVGYGTRTLVENEITMSLSDRAFITLAALIILAAVAAIAVGVIIATSIQKPLNKIVAAACDISQGIVDVEIDTGAKGEIGELSHAFAQVIKTAKEQAAVIAQIAQGNLAVEVTPRSDQDMLNLRLQEMLRELRDLIDEIDSLAQAATAGDLSVRGDEEKFQGDFRKIVQGVNQTLAETTRPITEALAVLEQVAEGNLQVMVEGDYQGDHALIKDAINKSLNAFNEVLNNILVASQQVAAGAKQISDASMALSQGATEQASSIEQLTASLEEILAQTKQNAANASEANLVAGTARENALQGNKEMEAMLEAMHEINESSNNISKIIKVIDEIAFQTNILALNAAVEAARAGQHGKGFAVVAEEVRNLAVRSANAAKETTELIEGSIEKADDGTRIAQRTAEAFNEIVENIAQAAKLVEQIAIASNEQAIGLAQINEGVMQISQVVQTNSATSEEGAAASEELASQAEMLRQQVAGFKLREQTQDALPEDDLVDDAAAESAEESEEEEVLALPAEAEAEETDVEETGGNGLAAVAEDDSLEEAGVEDLSLPEAAATAEPRILLSDQEFGKY